MNPDPPTSLTNIKTTKLIYLKSLAKNILDGFPKEDVSSDIPFMESALHYRKIDILSNHQPRDNPKTLGSISQPSL